MLENVYQVFADNVTLLGSAEHLETVDDCRN